MANKIIDRIRQEITDRVNGMGVELLETPAKYAGRDHYICVPFGSLLPLGSILIEWWDSSMKVSVGNVGENLVTEHIDHKFTERENRDAEGRSRYVAYTDGQGMFDTLVFVEEYAQRARDGKGRHTTQGSAGAA